ncbi:MAG: hypothetical protein AAF721_06050 [Myxococcota bacterium]
MTVCRLAWLACSVAAAACASPGPSEPQRWEAPGTAHGKAAGAQALIPGDAIPSAFVDPDARYLASRSRRTLRDLGASADGRTLTDQADRAPRDERISAEELVAFEDSEFFASLPGAEQERLSEVWSWLEAPASDVAPVDLIAPTEDLDTEDRSVHHDADDPDLAEAVVAVPPPGSVVDATTFGPVLLERTITTRYLEERSLVHFRENQYKQYWAFSVVVTASRETLAQARFEPGQSLVLIDVPTGEEHHLASDRLLVVPAGDYLAEAWSDGERVSIGFVTTAEVRQNGAAVEEEVKLSEFAAHRFETLDGDALHRHELDPGPAPTGASVTQGTRRRFEYGTDPADDVEWHEFELPEIAVAPGTYAFASQTLGEVEVDVFPAGAVRVAFDDRNRFRGRHVLWLRVGTNGRKNDRELAKVTSASTATTAATSTRTKPGFGSTTATTTSCHA